MFPPLAWVGVPPLCDGLAPPPLVLPLPVLFLQSVFPYFELAVLFGTGLPLGAQCVSFTPESA
jgi:hypothetical protein